MKEAGNLVGFPEKEKTAKSARKEEPNRVFSPPLDLLFFSAQVKVASKKD
jgi:hypothetical protein